MFGIILFICYNVLGKLFRRGKKILAMKRLLNLQNFRLKRLKSWENPW